MLRDCRTEIARIGKTRKRSTKAIDDIILRCAKRLWGDFPAFKDQPYKTSQSIKDAVATALGRKRIKPLGIDAIYKRLKVAAR